MYRILLTMYEFSAYGFTDRSVFCSIARNIPMNLFKQEGMKLTLKNTEHLIYQITQIVIVAERYSNSERGVAQMVARMVWDHEVAGSRPVTPTK